MILVEEAKNIDKKTASKYRNKYIGFIFQSFIKDELKNVALPKKNP